MKRYTFDEDRTGNIIIQEYGGGEWVKYDDAQKEIEQATIKGRIEGIKKCKVMIDAVMKRS